MVFALDTLGSDLTPMSLFETLAAMVAIVPDPNKKHHMICPDHNVGGNCVCRKAKPFCSTPRSQHATSLGGDVDCATCRHAWHFAVNPSHHAEQMHCGATNDPYLKIVDAQACKCFACRDYLRVVMVG